MSYVKESLTKGERIIYTTNLHWIIFMESLSIIIIGLFISYLGVIYEAILGSFKTWLEYIALAVLVVGGVKFLLELIRHNTSEFAVTTERVVIKVGVIQRKSLAMHLTKIESIEINQSIIGRIFGFGSISITGTGNAESDFDLLRNPNKFREKMQWIAASDDNEIEAVHPNPATQRQRQSQAKAQENVVHRSSTTRRRRRRR
jgi:uncharacterized membrane protein YdbT with pleckstrin-like domain